MAIIKGTDGDDQIFGLSGNDVLIGFGGNDTLETATRSSRPTATTACPARRCGSYSTSWSRCSIPTLFSNVRRVEARRQWGLA